MVVLYVKRHLHVFLAVLLPILLPQLGADRQEQSDYALHVTKRGKAVRHHGQSGSHHRKHHRESVSEESERAALLKRADYLLKSIHHTDRSSGAEEHRAEHTSSQQHLNQRRNIQAAVARQRTHHQRQQPFQNIKDEIHHLKQEKRHSLEDSTGPDAGVNVGEASKHSASADRGAVRRHTHASPVEPAQDARAAAPVEGAEVVEQLRQQYDQLEGTLQTAKLQEQSLQKLYLAKLGAVSHDGFWALASGGIITFLLVLACALLLQVGSHFENWEETAFLRLVQFPKRVTLQILSLAWTFLSTLQCVMVYPRVYGLPQTIEYSSFSTLVMIGSVVLIIGSAMGARRMMRPWSQTRNRTVVLSFIAGHLCVALLHGAASDPADSWRLGPNLRGIALSMSRLGLGVCASFSNIFLMMTLKILPQESLMQFSIYRAGAMCLGASMGAICSSTSIVWVTLPWLLLACLAMALLPKDLQPLLAQLAASADDRAASKGTVQVYNMEDESVILSSRKNLWMVAAAATLVRGLLTAAFQTTSTNIYTKEFYFADRDASLAAGSSLACGVFVLPLALIAKQAAGLDMGRVTTWTSVCVALAAVMLFRPIANFVGGETAGMWLAFTANALALPAAHLLSGILEGFALQQARPDTLLNQENLITANLILQDGAVRTLGPPTMMYLYALGGQSICAAALLALASAAFAGTLIARAALAIISADDMDFKKGSITAAVAPPAEVAGKDVNEGRS